MDFELTEEQKMFQKLARDFADREIEPIADEIDREAKVPNDMLKKMADVGLLGILIPEEYGGLGMSIMTYILALEQLHYPVTAVTWFMAGQGLYELFGLCGTEEQKKEHIPPIVAGEFVPSGCFTEAATGSDPRLFVTTAVLEKGYWVINGVKRFATFGNQTKGFAIIYCKTGGNDVSGILVPRNTLGYSFSKPWGLMGCRGLESVDVFLRDVKVPESNVLGQPGMGMGLLAEMVVEGRLAIAIRSVACGQRSLDEAIKYAKERKTFKGPIAKMQGHQWLLAEMVSRVEASRLLTYKAAFLKEQHKPAAVAASTAKLFAGQAGEWVASQSLQIHGAYGYTTDYKIERIYRAAKQSQIAEGSNEVQRTNIGRALVSD
jgi:alkylation response protein AidB-like acyl-CoA dehydrogenase